VLEVVTLLWLMEPNNGNDYIKGSKTEAYRKFADYLEAQRVSPRTIKRTLNAIKQRISLIVTRDGQPHLDDPKLGLVPHTWPIGSREFRIQSYLIG
jgi:hypothetical protein